MTKRTDDAFGRRVIGALLLALLVEGIGWIYSFGVLAQKIETNGDSIRENKVSIEALRKVNDRLIRIEVLMETVVVSNGKIADSIVMLDAEQQGHVNDRSVHK